MSTTKKVAIAAFMSFAVMAAAPKAQAAGDAGVSLSFGAGFYQAVDNRKINGYNSNFGLNFALDEGTSVGLYREDLNLEGDEIADTAAPAADVKLETDIAIDINEVRISRTIVPQLVDVTLGFGGASITATTLEAGTSETVNREVPVIDVLGRVTAINSNGKKINAKLYVDLGYRFMDVRDIDIADDTAEINDVQIDDLSGFFGNLGASVCF